MTKNVIFYARYSTDLQNEVSIETQIEVGKEFIKKQGWKLVDIFFDKAVSGSDYKTRPGIQQVLERVKQSDIKIVLCITVDRISRDGEHGNAFLKRLDYKRAELWTVYAGTRVRKIDMGINMTLSHEMIDLIRYRTREGMKTSVKKGKASTCLAYGYMLSQARDANGDRIKGLRDIDPQKAEVVRRIFQMYVDGVSPRDIAQKLNEEGIEGPRGKKWRDTAIRGHVGRGTGILNNESYIGRLVWNRRNYRKNPDTERRVAFANEPAEWVTSEVPELRIIDDELWTRAKARQAEVGELFSHTQNNKLNATHRPSYLLSGVLECAECGGPYAISGKDRYSCTNHRKRLPIDELGGECCSNRKTIKRQDLEERVITCLSPCILQHGHF